MMSLEIENIGQVFIEAIVTGVDESILRITIPGGYKIIKVYLEDFKNLKRIIDGNDNIHSDYYSSINEGNASGGKRSLFVLEKSTSIIPPKTRINPLTIYSNNKYDFNIEEHKEFEANILLNIIYLMQVYKQGDIGIREIFFDYHLNQRPIGTFDVHYSRKIYDLKPYCKIKYYLNDNEIEWWDKFYKDNVNTSLVLMKDVVLLFSFALKQIETALKLVLLTTALEMMFLNKEENISELLSRRVALFTKTNDMDILQRYKIVKKNYKHRSDLVHNGKFEKITEEESYALEETTRECIKSFFLICNREISNNQKITWEKIKEKTLKMLDRKIDNESGKGKLFYKLPKNRIFHRLI